MVLYIVKWIFLLLRIKVFRIAVLVIVGFYLLGFLFEDLMGQMGTWIFLTMIGFGIIAFLYHVVKRFKEQLKIEMSEEGIKRREKEQEERMEQERRDGPFYRLKKK